jgi:hypothetical protein
MDVRAVLKSDRLRVSAVLGIVAIIMAVSAAGFISGVGLLILMMIQMKEILVVLSSLLLSFSAVIFLICYIWLTG